MSDATTNTTTSSDDNDNDNNGDGEGSLLRQTLMTVDECFVYKIPPMVTSGGHRYVTCVCLLVLLFVCSFLPSFLHPPSPSSFRCLLTYLLTYLLTCLLTIIFYKTFSPEPNTGTLPNPYKPAVSKSNDGTMICISCLQQKPIPNSLH
jgi:hypothetical protein